MVFLRLTIHLVPIPQNVRAAKDRGPRRVENGWPSSRRRSPSSSGTTGRPPRRRGSQRRARVSMIESVQRHRAISPGAACAGLRSPRDRYGLRSGCQGYTGERLGQFCDQFSRRRHHRIVYRNQGRVPAAWAGSSALCVIAAVTRSSPMWDTTAKRTVAISGHHSMSAFAHSSRARANPGSIGTATMHQPSPLLSPSFVSRRRRYTRIA